MYVVLDVVGFRIPHQIQLRSCQGPVCEGSSQCHRSPGNPPLLHRLYTRQGGNVNVRC